MAPYSASRFFNALHTQFNLPPELYINMKEKFISTHYSKINGES